MDYLEFIASKTKRVESYGFDVNDDQLNPHLKDFQRTIVKWGIRRGRAAFFCGTGLGKTVAQLDWSRLVVEHTNKPVLIICPLGVRAQTVSESVKFSIGCKCIAASSQDDVDGPGIFVTNFERLHLFDTDEFSGVAIDESSILKSLTGKIRTDLINRFAHTRFRLCCTATPAPNDHIELGNHAEFLGVCSRVEMMSKYFVNDSGDTSKWRLKGHAQESFWEWVAMWAICVGMPSDIGGDDTGYILHPLLVNRHIVVADVSDPVDGMLFNTSGLSATNVHEEKRLTLKARVDKAIELASIGDGPCLVWCDTNYESDALIKGIPNAIDVRGSHKAEIKEERLSAFARGDINCLISKPSIAGMGMNFQVANRMVFAGLSYSFESYFQSVRRCWRFGQSMPVKVDIVLAETESSISSAIARKESDYYLMQEGMANAMRKATLAELEGDRVRTRYEATNTIQIPSFLCQAVATSN